MDADLRALVEAPLADPLKVNLPKGRRPAPKSAKIEYDDIGGEKLTRAQVRERVSAAADARHKQLLDYYATTSVPVDRIASHLRMEVVHVVAAMKLRGRVINQTHPQHHAGNDLGDGLGSVHGGTV